jgi:hypothetical protein
VFCQEKSFIELEKDRVFSRQGQKPTLEWSTCLFDTLWPY